MPIVSACMLECLTTWHTSGRGSGLVDLAVSSVSLAVYSRVQHSLPAAKEAVRTYSQLLHAAQSQIIDAGSQAYAGAASDATLLTIIMMATYETVMHKPANVRDPLRDISGTQHSWSHHIGALTVLRHWLNRTDNVTTPAYDNIIRQGRRGIMRFAFMMRHPLPTWLQDGSLFGEHGLDLEFDRVFFQVVNLRSAFTDLYGHSTPIAINNEEAMALLVEATRLEGIIDQWQAKVPSEWAPTAVNTEGESGHNFFSSIINTYKKPIYAAIWLQYFAVRVIIKSMLLKLCQWVPENQWQCNVHQSQLTTYVERFANDIPFALGRVITKIVDTQGSADSARSADILEPDQGVQPALALFAAWPLTIVSNLDTLASEQRSWFRTQLAQLGRVLGDGALECAAKGGGEWD
ncbi:hypothetical protein NW762_008049 [Fusarium torreyae]|uniref:Uncharacterized protein n=1 Tax=Fusarium torreyae TaxID=1237075 RepID=A0A9W8RYF6_9HYPO|nr:hypothetical protein NW762_008049 [Fusarium torreyae]